MRRMGTAFAWAAFIVLMVTGPSSPASAQCSDPAKHFRSGLWKHWIYQMAPGPAALGAVHRIIDEINVSRAQAGLPLLVFDLPHGSSPLQRRLDRQGSARRARPVRAEDLGRARGNGLGGEDKVAGHGGHG
jgi:hypothetical protein